MYMMYRGRPHTDWRKAGIYSVLGTELKCNTIALMEATVVATSSYAATIAGGMRAWTHLWSLTH